MKTNLEICVDGLESALIAQQSGADRLELCGELSVGGLTPSMGLINQIRDRIQIPVNVMIRPRSGDFCYTDDEYETMLENVQSIKKNFPEVHGFVTGILTPEGHLHMKRMKQLVDASRPIPVTLHRAFDMSIDMKKSLEDCLALGIERILTGGFANKAMDGLENLKLLQEWAGQRLIIMPGSGINAGNVESLIEALSPREIHMSAKRAVPSLMTHQNPALQMGRSEGVNEYMRNVTNGEEIELLCKILQEHGF